MAKKKFSLKNWINGDDEEVVGGEDQFYDVTNEEKEEEVSLSGSQMILMEPRAFSESQQIANHLKHRNSVVVNLKRVTSDQAKRIIDFLSGCIYAIGGSMQKVGVGIYLCAPKNVNVQGEISEDKNDENEEDW